MDGCWCGFACVGGGVGGESFFCFGELVVVRVGGVGTGTGDVKHVRGIDMPDCDGGREGESDRVRLEWFLGSRSRGGSLAAASRTLGARLASVDQRCLDFFRFRLGLLWLGRWTCGTELNAAGEITHEARLEVGELASRWAGRNGRFGLGSRCWF